MVNITEAIYCLVFRAIVGIILLYGLNLKSERIMQDFTKQNATLSNLNTKQPKWLNKDRLWNFVFWFGMSFGFAAGLVISEINSKQNTFSYWSSFFFWSTIVGVPMIVRYYSKTTLIKKDTFANSEGVLISKKQMPYSFPLAAISGLAIAFIVAELFLSNTNFYFISSLILSFSFFSGISLYFILKNCPISILFNRKFWTFEFKAGTNNKSRLFKDDFQGRSSKEESLNRLSPARSYRSNNVYYRHR